MSTPAQGAVGAETMTAVDPVAILYTNYRGETAVRRIMPCYHPDGHDALWFGKTWWHPEPQWLLSAVDCENEHWITRPDSGLARRDFAVADIKAWGQAAVDAALATPRTDSDETTADEGTEWFWRIVDANGLGNVPSDETEALRLLCTKAARYDEMRASPAPSSPGVPDSVRALSEAASPDWDTNEATPYILGPPIDGEIDRFEVIARGPHGHAKSGDAIRKWQANRMFAVAAVNFVRTLIAAQPAGQAGDAGARIAEIVNRWHDWIVSASADMDQPEGSSGSRQTMEDDRDFLLRALPAQKPAPNSTRTGAAETEDALASAIEERWTALIGLAYEGGWVGWKRRDLCREFAKAALAARPEAPSDAGWSREDLEAFVAREWPEGRSAGAAARELVRALGARGLAPTLQRLLTDLLGQINFASTDRAQILADFANAAPEAARMAKIDSFERWNPRVFDPTPPTDPAPSGQAEG